MLEVVVDDEEIEVVLFQNEVDKVEVKSDTKTQVITLMQRRMTLIAMENRKMTILKGFGGMEMGPFPQLICQISVELFGLKILTRKAKAKKPIGFPH